MASIFSGLLALLTVGSIVDAVSVPPVNHHHHHDIARRSANFEQYRLKTVPEYTPAGQLPTEAGLLPSGSSDYVSVAKELLKKTLPNATFRVVEDHYVGQNGVGHVHFKQTAHDVDIDNADFNVNVARDGSVFSYGSSFYAGELPAASEVESGSYASPVQALQDVSTTLGLPVRADDASAEHQGDHNYAIRGAIGLVQDPRAKLVYFQTEKKDRLVLSWRVETDVEHNWLLSYADAKDTKQVLGVVDYINDATYQVYPFGQVNDPSKGSRVAVTDPWDTASSVFTWQGDGASTYTTTRGNNGVAGAHWDVSTQWQSEPRPSNAGSDFSYPFSLQESDFKAYANASVTQLFYQANMYHDLLYTLGFTEQAGNFEQNNDGKGGVGGDMVILNAQDGGGTNNANFATPPDGQSGRMRMYMWTTAAPKRDGAFDASVVLHEYTHGLSNRLTGGPANTGCLSSVESGGMGEGWSDFFAIAIGVKGNDTRAVNYPMGAWVFNNAAGIRKYLYSTNMNTNPHTYKDVADLSEVHAIGTIWATVLYELLWNLIDAHGNTAATHPTLDSNGIPTDGRHLTMKIVMDALALQPCQPTFLQARDAIVDADTALTQGQNKCNIWKAFAKRGLGDGAQPTAQSFTIPTGVC